MKLNLKNQVTLKIKYLSTKLKTSNSNIVLFTNKKLDVSIIKKNFSNSEFSYIKDLLKNADLKKKIFIFEINSNPKKIANIKIKNRSRYISIT